MSASTATALRRLQEWYYAQCDEEWEHSYGVTISTVDNPGWSLSVELTDTALENKPFVTIQKDADDREEWIHCSVRDGKFIGSGGPLKLEAIIEIFLAWAEES